MPVFISTSVWILCIFYFLLFRFTLYFFTPIALLLQSFEIRTTELVFTCKLQRQLSVERWVDADFCFFWKKNSVHKWNLWMCAICEDCWKQSNATREYNMGNFFLFLFSAGKMHWHLKLCLLITYTSSNQPTKWFN